MEKYRFPIRELMDDFALGSGMDNNSFCSYQRHVEPLGIVAGRRLLVIGAGDRMQELAVVEPQISQGITKEAVLLSRDGFFDCYFYNEVRRLYPKLRMARLPISYQVLFENDPQVFDTVMFIGREGVPKLCNEEISCLASRLSVGGRAFITDNISREEDFRREFDVPNCKVKVIPAIPDHPIFNIFSWQGIVVERLK